MSDSVRLHGLQPTRLSSPWDSPGKNTGVGCHFLLQCMKVKSQREVAQSCPTLSDLMDCSLRGSSVRGIFQARVLEWGAIAFSIATLEHIKKKKNHSVSIAPFLPLEGMFLELSIPQLLNSRLTHRISFHPLLGISLISPMLNPVSISSLLAYSLFGRLPIVS